MYLNWLMSLLKDGGTSEKASSIPSPPPDASITGPLELWSSWRKALLPPTLLLMFSGSMYRWCLNYYCCSSCAILKPSLVTIIVLGLAIGRLFSRPKLTCALFRQGAAGAKEEPGYPVNCWTMALKLVVLSKVAGVCQETLDLFRMGLNIQLSWDMPHLDMGSVTRPSRVVPPLELMVVAGPIQVFDIYNRFRDGRKCISLRYVVWLY